MRPNAPSIITSAMFCILPDRFELVAKRYRKRRQHHEHKERRKNRVRNSKAPDMKNVLCAQRNVQHTRYDNKLMIFNNRNGLCHISSPKH